MDRHLSEMKYEWDKRAQEEAKWYINTLRRQQTDEEFDVSGLVEVQRLILSELELLTDSRDAKDLRLLEIGCGIGRMTRHLAEIFGEVYGVDVSAEMIRQAKERLKSLANVSLFETNGVDFALFPEAFFDLAFSAYVFQHIPSAEIIASNIKDALRVLRPGGMFKFVVNATASESFLQSQKDSWAGDSFPEERIRRLASESKAQLVGIIGEETQYCWIMLRRRRTARPPTFRQETPKIILCGHADELSLPAIQLNSERPYLTLILKGDFNEWDDANNVTVQIGTQQFLPRYVGALGRNVMEFLSPKRGSTETGLLQINVKLEGALAGGEREVMVRFFDSAVSDTCSVKLI